MINLLIATGILLLGYIIVGIIVIKTTNRILQNKYPEAKKPKKEEIDRLLELDDFEYEIGNSMKAIR